MERAARRQARGLGSSPRTAAAASGRRDRGSARRREAPGCRGAAGVRTAPRSRRARRSCPRYMTATRCEMWRTSRRSWATNRIGQAEPALQLEQQVDDLRLHRDVEGGDQLVGDQAFGLERKGPGDADPLALAARELVRIAVAPHRRGSRTSSSSSAIRPGIAGGAAQPVDRERLAQHRAHRLARVERAVGVLEDHLHLAVDRLRQAVAPERADVLAGVADAARIRPRAGAPGSGPGSTCRSRTRRRCPASRHACTAEADAVQSLDDRVAARAAGPRPGRGRGRTR